MIRWLRFWLTTTRAAAAVFLLAIFYAVALIVMYFPRSPKEEDQPDEGAGPAPMCPDELR